MRIGSFELDCVFNPCFVLAEVASGEARLLRFARIQNVRGTRTNWLRLYAEIDGRRTRQKPGRELAPGDAARAAGLERDLREALVAPRNLAPGRYTGRLHVYSDSDEEAELPFDFEVLDERTIPTDFVRSRLLAAYISEDDALRGFAAQALENTVTSDSAATLRALYGALLERQLSYQPPVNTRVADCQRVSDMRYVLERGGSCADLSLLMASLLWCRGESPALLLFPDHMAVGCFVGEPPAFDTLEDAGAILSLESTGALALVEVTALCGYRQKDFEQARRSLLDRLASGVEPCQLVNVAHVLRSGAVSLLSKQIRSARCPHCGYDRLTPKDLASGGACPACGQPLIMETSGPERAEAPEEADGSGLIQYILARGVSTVKRLMEPDAEWVRVAPVWQGHAVRHVGERAFERCGVRRVVLPDSISSIGDYAFYGCAALEAVRLPNDLRQIGAGAFCGSGLREIRIPGGVERVPRMAFSGCVALERVQIDDGVRFIDSRAFADCRSLRSARIPASVERVARGAFDPGCELLLASGKTRVES